MKASEFLKDLQETSDKKSSEESICNNLLSECVTDFPCTDCPFRSKNKLTEIIQMLELIGE